MLQAIDSCPAPVVCRVHGFALGGGSGLAACADIVVASPDAVFGFTEVKLGIIPAVISPFVLAKIGSSARRVFTTGERFGAETAQRIGLVDEIAEDVEGEAERIVARAADLGRRRSACREAPGAGAAGVRGSPVRRGADANERRGPGGPPRVPGQAPRGRRRRRWGVFAPKPDAG